MKISVAMCTYNGAAYIKEQLDSIFAQSVLPNEIIIQDDNSTDNTIEIIQTLYKNGPVPIRLFVNNPSLGVMKNFISAFGKCEGDIIISCDQDDIWAVNKVEVLKSVFQEKKNISMVATDALLIDDTGVLLNHTLQETLDFSIPSNHEEFIYELLRKYCITGATMAIRKDFITKYIYESKYWLHDGLLGIIAAMKNEFLFLEQTLTKYRLHSHQVCGVSMRNSWNEMKTSFLKPFYNIDLANHRYHRFKEVLVHLDIVEVPPNNIEELASCINFWDERRKLNNISLNQCLKEIINRIRKNQYKKYTLYTYGCVVDFYTWIICHLFRRR